MVKGELPLLNCVYLGSNVSLDSDLIWIRNPRMQFIAISAFEHINNLPVFVQHLGLFLKLD